MTTTFVTLPGQGLRINLAHVTTVQDCGKFTRVRMTELTHSESGYAIAQEIDLYGDDINILYKALDQLDILNADPKGLGMQP